MRRATPWLLVTAAIGGALGVGFGAFGAHALRDVLDAARLATWHTAVDYLFWHVLAALFAAYYAQAKNMRAAAIAALLFLAGVAIFSGSLFALALGAPRWLGAVTPLGGSALIAGWLLLAWAVARRWT